MNTFPTTFYPLIATTIIIISNTYSQETPQKLTQKLTPGKILYINKFTILSAALASKCDKTQLAQQAAISTGGLLIDKIIDSKSISIDIIYESMGNFLGLYITYKVYELANYYEMNIDFLAKKCDVLPDGPIRDIINPVTRLAVDTATHPGVAPLLVTAIGTMFPIKS